MVHFVSLLLGLLAALSPLSNASPVVGGDVSTRALTGTQVNVRIEGADNTIFEGPVKTKGRTITTKSGGTHKCDGTNNGANPIPGPTCTTAMADSASLSLTYDGTWDSNFDDFFITRIGPSTQTSTQFWGVLLNWQFAPVGGCQQQIAEGDSVLWAFDAFNKVYFLKLDGPTTTQVGVPIQVTVSDGPSGVMVSAASVAGTDASSSGLTDPAGRISITFSSKGTKKIKASRADSLRSNYLTVVVA